MTSNSNSSSAKSEQELLDYISGRYGSKAAEEFKALLESSGMDYVKEDLGRAFSYMDADCGVMAKMASACNWDKSQSRRFFNHAKKILDLDQDWEYWELLNTGEITPEIISLVEHCVDILADAIINHHKESYQMEWQQNKKKFLETYSEFLDLTAQNQFAFDVAAKYFRKKYNFKCEAEECQCINSLKNREKEETYGGISMICNIHCTILHVFDTGRRFNFKEMKMLGLSNDVDEFKDDNHNRNHNSDSGCFFLSASEHEKRHNKVMQMMDSKKENIKVFRGKPRFMQEMEPEDEEEKDDRKEDDDDDDGDNNANRNEDLDLYYSFGYRFYYWPTFEHNTNIDRCNRGGREYKFWFIRIKYDGFKDEMLTNDIYRISILTWDSQRERARDALEVERRVCTHNDGIHYGIANYAVTTVEQFMALLLYTDETILSTAFSRTFRRTAENPTIAAVKESNRNFREFSRLLSELVHCFGTRLCDSPISNFYHGIKHKLNVSSTYAAFYSPTSTSTDMFKASKFTGNSGLLLVIKNTSYSQLRYIDTNFCLYPDEKERLFFQGGSNINFTSKNEIHLPFSVYDMGYTEGKAAEKSRIRGEEEEKEEGEEEEEPFTSALNALQHIICGTSRQYTNDFFKNHSENLKLMIKAAKGGLRSEKIPDMPMRMFSEFVAGVERVQIMAPYFNMPEVYKSYRRVFCYLRKKSRKKPEWAIREMNRYNNVGYTNMIKCVRFKLLMELFPRLRNLEVLQLPVTRHVMDQLLKIVRSYGKQPQQQQQQQQQQEEEEEEEENRNTNRRQQGGSLERIFLGEGCVLPEQSGGGAIQTCSALCYPPSQSDFPTYQHCCDEYSDKFGPDWLLTVVHDRATDGNSTKLVYFSGIVIKLRQSHLQERHVWNHFHNFHL